MIFSDKMGGDYYDCPCVREGGQQRLRSPLANPCRVLFQHLDRCHVMIAC